MSEPVTIAAHDAADLAEVMEFLCGWLDDDRDRLSASLWRFAPSTSIAELRDELLVWLRRLGGPPVYFAARR